MSRNYDCLTIRLQKGKLKLYIFIFGVCKINNGKGDYFMKQYKKCMCMLLTTAMVSQLAISASGANAAAKPKLSTKSVKVTVGKSKKVTVKNVKGYKIKVKSAKKKIATVKTSGKKAFVIKGIKKGNTKITCIAKKGAKKITLKCNVKVHEDTTANTPVIPDSQTNVTASPVGASTPAPAPANPTVTPVPTATPLPVPTPIKVTLATDVPAEYREDAKEADPSMRGKIELVTYDTETYDEGKSVKMEKQANVYLPAGYDESKKYNVLYLMHGGGENINTWLVENDYTGNKKMVDNLIANGEIEPLIIVTPTFYRPSGVPENSDLTTQFKYELRKDLIPYIESHYSTYAGGDVSDENLIKTRMHRAFAGLSMGSMTTYRSALYANYDVFAWFGPFSGCQGPDGDKDEEVEKITSVIENGVENGMPLGFLYCGNGVDDIAHDEHVEIMKKAVEQSDQLVEGANYAFIDLPKLDRLYGGCTGEHSMWSWHIHLYNCLRVFFTRE